MAKPKTGHEFTAADLAKARAGHVSRSKDKYCPKCGKYAFEIARTTATKLGRSRRRKCAECGHEASTLELPLLPGLRVVFKRLLRAQGVQLPLFP